MIIPNSGGQPNPDNHVDLREAWSPAARAAAAASRKARSRGAKSPFAKLAGRRAFKAAGGVRGKGKGAHPGQASFARRHGLKYSRSPGMSNLWKDSSGRQYSYNIVTKRWKVGKQPTRRAKSVRRRNPRQMGSYIYPSD